MYERGNGVPQGFVQAHKWYNLAAANGEKVSGELRDTLAKQMTLAQIAEAQRLAREWKSKSKRITGHAPNARACPLRSRFFDILAQKKIQLA